MRLKQWLNRPLGRSPYPLGTLAIGMLGLIIGSALLLSCLALAAGARTELAELERAFGQNAIVIRPDRAGAAMSPSLVTELESRLDKASQVFGVTERQAIIARPGLVSVQALFVGADSRLALMKGWTLAEGRLLMPDDLTQGRKVIVLGSLIADRLFPSSEKRTVSRIGSEVLVDGMPFTVAGILAQTPAADAGTLSDGDGCILVPLTTAIALKGNSQLSSIVVQAPTQASIRSIAGHARIVLTKLGGATYTLTTARDAYRDAYAVTTIATWLFAGVSAIALALGAISLWLTLRFGLKERRAEFSIRLAQGATRRQLLWECLGDAVNLGLWAGGGGVMAGLAIAGALASAITWPIRIGITNVFLCLLSGVIVATLAGIQPAVQAARLDPSTHWEIQG